MEEGMRLQPHVVWRGGKFYYRRRIPQHLKGYFAPKKEIKFSLRTSDRAQAVRHVRAKDVYYDDYFAHLERLTAHRQRVVTQVDQELIQLVCDKYRASVLTGDQNLREDPACRDILLHYMEQREQTAKTLRSAVALCDIAYIKQPFEQFLDLCGITLDCSQDDYQKLSHVFLRCVCEVHDIQVKRDQGYFEETPDFKYIENKEHHFLDAVTKGTTLLKSISWETVFTAWLDADVDRNPKTIQEYRTTWDNFVKMSALANPAEASRQTVQGFRDYLRHQRQLKPKTIHKKIGIIRSIFQVAIDEEYLEKNPALRIKIAGQTESSDRLPFEKSDIVRIKQALSRREESGLHTYKKEAEYWITLIAMYTSCRLEEIAQLRTLDIKSEDGIHYLLIQEDMDSIDPTMLKNKASNRRIPIHDDLITQYGLLDFVAEKIKQNEGRLFPSLERDKYGKLSSAWSKWFGRFLRSEVGIKDTRKVFHSFRHRFKDLCREAGLQDELSDALMGHSGGNKSSTGRDYGKGYSLRALYAAVMKLDVT